MLNNLTTEGRNPASEAIDTLAPLEIVRLMNAEDAGVAAAVGREAEPIALAIEAIAERLRRGGRLIYLGAGTSGRLGVLDATECPPTFNSPPGQVVGLIAGGPEALTRAIEGAEDRPELAVEDLQRIQLTAGDAVVGIATSGRTPYVVGGLQHARGLGAFTVALSCNAASSIADCAELAIAPIVGPEVISGSTRLKAGTATKLVLNMLTTGAMVLLGKTYGNLMVDLRATNSKLRDRAARIVAHLTRLSDAESRALLNECDGELKTAVVLDRLRQNRIAGVSSAAEQARQLLQQAGGQLRGALEAAGGIDRRQASGLLGEDLLLGIDGGGTGVVALLARRNRDGAPILLGRGTAGPANPQVVGFEAACRTIDLAIDAAFAEGGRKRIRVSSGCLALAGAGRDEDRQRLEAWAARQQVAARFQQVHDALPVLAAGTPEGWGIALIAGTGSLVFGRNVAGETARAGGWGYLLGDEGSAYWMSLEGLRAVAQAADGHAPATSLTDSLLSALGIAEPQELIGAVYGRKLDRAALAGLAPLVIEAAVAGDPVAEGIVDFAACDLAALVDVVARRLNLVGQPFPLALAGGVLTGSSHLRQQLEEGLRKERFLIPSPVTLVTEPAEGALKLAAAALRS